MCQARELALTVLEREWPEDSACPEASRCRMLLGWQGGQSAWSMARQGASETQVGEQAEQVVVGSLNRKPSEKRQHWRFEAEQWQKPLLRFPL